MATQPAPAAAPAAPAPTAAPAPAANPSALEAATNATDAGAFAAAVAKYADVPAYELGNPQHAFLLALEASQFIRENKLTHHVNGKEYVMVEGWQYIGSRLGLVPEVMEVLNLSADGEIKYQAFVRLYDLKRGHAHPAGFAVCSNKENGKKFYAEYAICSMAQTRGIGKAYRNVLAQIIRMAGFEPTPAEEMDYQTTPTPTPANGTPANGHQGAAPATPAAGGAAPAAAPTMQVQAATEAVAVPDVRYASAKQKEEIIRLLNNPVITRAEKTKMLLNINKLDDQRAATSVEKLRKTIKEREGEQRVAG